MKFTKKPVTIEAIQFRKHNHDEIKRFLGKSFVEITTPPELNGIEELTILTLEDGHDNRAKHIATEGDWIIKGIHGEFYPCKPDIFEETYVLY